MKRDKYEAMNLVGAAGIPAGAVRDTLELSNDPDFVNRRTIQPIQHPGYGAFKAITWPVSFDGKKATVKPAPLLGADTGGVLQDWLGMDAAQISALTTDKVVGPQLS